MKHVDGVIRLALGQPSASQLVPHEVDHFHNEQIGGEQIVIEQRLDERCVLGPGQYLDESRRVDDLHVVGGSRRRPAC